MFQCGTGFQPTGTKPGITLGIIELLQIFVTCITLRSFNEGGYLER